MYSVCMPEIVDSMPTTRPGRRGTSSYDWSIIFDGRVHRFTPDEVPSTPRNFAKQVRAAALRRDLRVSIVVRAAQGVYVQRLDTLQSC
jgi:hypothetical protein